MDDRIMKYINIGLGVAIAVVAICAGVLFWKDKQNEVETAAEQEQAVAELATETTEEAAAETSYIDIPGWTDRSEIKGEKEGISLEEAAAASSSAASAASTTKKTTASTAASTTKKTTASTAASTTKASTAASSASTTKDASTASSVITTVTDDDMAKLNEWKSDENNHWKAASPNDKSAHTYNTNGVCTVCGYKLTWSYTASYHYHNVNGTVKDKGDHTLSNGVCTVCGYKASSTGATGASAWNWDDTYHWHVSNGKVVDQVKHVYNSNGICTVCGYENLEVSGTSDLKWQADGGNGHYKLKNGVKVQMTAHNFNKDGVCKDCGYSLSGYGSDSTGHWFVNMGGKATETVAHTFDGHKCTVCGYVSDHEYKSNGSSTHKCTICGDEKDHTFGSDGKCTVCGYEKPAPEPDPEPVTPEQPENPDEGNSEATTSEGTNTQSETGEDTAVS